MKIKLTLGRIIFLILLIIPSYTLFYESKNPQLFTSDSEYTTLALIVNALVIMLIYWEFVIPEITEQLFSRGKKE